MQVRDRVKSLRRVKASDLLPNPKNWRTHGKPQAGALRDVLEQVGIAGAVLAREVGGKLMLIDGHLRAETLPDQKIPVLVLDVTEAEADLLLASYDPLSAMAGANGEILDSVLQGIEANGEWLNRMLEATAKKAGCEWRSTDGEVIEDEVPEPPAEPVSKLGDVWRLGDNLLICGDSTDADVVGRLLGDEKPLLMITDPPYGVDYDPAWRVDLAKKGHLWFTPRNVEKIENDDRADWTEAYKLFPGDVAYIWHAGLQSAVLLQSLWESGFECRSQIIWKKPRLAISRGHYHWQHEPCWYAVRHGKTSHWTGDRKQSTIWDVAQERGQPHATQKPVECMARPIRNHGKESDAVYDPFMGSGTTLIAAEQLGRRCFGVELDPKYVDVTVERWENLTGLKAERV